MRESVIRFGSCDRVSIFLLEFRGEIRKASYVRAPGKSRFASLGTTGGSRRLPWRSAFGDGGIAPIETGLIAARCAHCRRSVRLGHWALHPCTVGLHPAAADLP